MRRPAPGDTVLDVGAMVAAGSFAAGVTQLAAPHPDVVASLVQQRKVKRMLRTKAQREAERLAADADTLTTALVALGAEPAGGGAS